MTKTLEAVRGAHKRLEQEIRWLNDTGKISMDGYSKAAEHLETIRAALMETHKGEVDRDEENALEERDNYHEWADRLANGIAEHFGVDIGEHSNLNNPWVNACEEIESQTPAPDVETITLSPAEMEELERQLDLPPKTIPALQKLLEDSHLCTAEVSEALETHDPKMNVKFKEDK